MKRFLIATTIALLFSPVLPAQESTPAGPPMEPQGPQAPQAPGPRRSSPPAQEVVPVPVPIVPPKQNGPVQKSLVRITATSVEPDYRAPWNSGGIQRGVGAGFVIGGKGIVTSAHVVSNISYLTVERAGVPTKVKTSE